MAIRIVRLGSARLPHEGLRLGTVRRPPRGVRKTDYAKHNYFDLWLPTLSPSAAAVHLALKARSEEAWQRFVRRYRREMSAPAPRTLLRLLAALSRRVDLSVGCYCEDETRCHRSILRELLRAQGARLSGARSRADRTSSAPRRVKKAPRPAATDPRTRPPRLRSSRRGSR
jgi:uncharacterized protein YeaO (DUF488 family)